MPACSANFWFKLRDELPEAALAAAARTVLAANNLPAHLPEGLADELPEGPGVYRFFGADDALLYVGRSKVAAQREFSAILPREHADSGERKLGRQVRRVDWLETAGELGALLREAEWIKTQQPLYNRRLRPAADSCTLRLAEDTGAAELLAIADVAPAELTRCCGVFHSRQGRAQGADRNRPRAAAVPEGPGARAERGFVLRLPGR